MRAVRLGLLGFVGLLGACTGSVADPGDGDAAPPPLPPIVGQGGAAGVGGADGVGGAGAQGGGAGQGGQAGAGGQGGGGREPGCLSVPERCDAVDNDCDGNVDEIFCPCNGAEICFAGPVQAQGVGECSDGTRMCEPNGEAYGPCAGSQGPVAEDCDMLDNDCDGLVDEFCDELGMGGSGGAAPMGGGGGEGGVPGFGDSEESFVVGEQRNGRPVDFVMAVDNSGSMDDTVDQVERNLGAFATRLAQANVDYHVVLVSERGTRRDNPDICIPEPLAGPNCADTDRFIHLDREVDSNDAFERIVQCYDRCAGSSYRDFLRPGSLLQFVVVTDDESDMNWPDFRLFFIRNNWPGFIVHGIVGLVDQGCVAERGDEYIRAANETGGRLLHICDNDWGEVIDVLLDVTVTQLQRTFRLAGAPEPASIRVFIVDANGIELEQVGNWSYDALGNAVVFAEGAMLLAGAQVVIRYQSR